MSTADDHPKAGFPAPRQSLSISAVERDTGLAKDTLRVWERRYGFPQPLRDQLGERAYPVEQVERLRLIKRLMDRGLRPGKIVGLPFDELQTLAAATLGAEGGTDDHLQRYPDLAPYLDMIGAHRIDELKQALGQGILRQGLHRFILEVVAPLNGAVGDYWAHGRFAVFEEHLYTEALQSVMRNALATVPQPAARDASPRVLMTTLPHEPHGLGLLMAEAMFSLEGAHCLSLGTQTPVLEIAEAARIHGSDIVALSCSSSVASGKVSDGLRDLAAALPPGVQIWAGGSNPALERPPSARITVLGLAAVADAVRDWRAAHSH